MKLFGSYVGRPPVKLRAVGEETRVQEQVCKSAKETKSGRRLRRDNGKSSEGGCNGGNSGPGGGKNMNQGPGGVQGNSEPNPGPPHPPTPIPPPLSATVTTATSLGISSTTTTV
jgi:hypothetical protein